MILKIKIMNKINEIKLPKGVESISVTQHDDKIVIKFIPEKSKFKEGDFVYEDGRIMIVKNHPNNYYAIIYPKLDRKPIYNRRYAPTMPLSSLSFRYATEDEKQLLIDAMEKDGKQWNAEKLKIEDILKKGDLTIFWDDAKTYAAIRLYGWKYREYYCDNFGTHWKHAIKFESKEQFEKLLRGEI
jgi:hypothetical protein